MKSLFNWITNFIQSIFAALWWLLRAVFFGSIILIVAIGVYQYSQNEGKTVAGTFEMNTPSSGGDASLKSMEIPFRVDYGTKWVHPNQIAHVKSLSKDIMVYICEDDNCQDEDYFKVKRMSLNKMQLLLEERGMSCFFRLKTDLLNLKYYEEHKKEHYGGTVYDYWIVMRNGAEANLPKDRRREFKDAVNSCVY